MTTDEKKELLQKLLNELAVAAQEKGCEISLATCRFSFADDSPMIGVIIEKEELEEEKQDEEA